MIFHLLRLKVDHHNRANAIKTLQVSVGPTKARKGCVTCCLHSHVDNDDELLLIQKWESKEALENFVKSKEFIMILEGMELSIEQPKLEIYDVKNTSGIDFIEQLIIDSKDSQKKAGFDT